MEDYEKLKRAQEKSESCLSCSFKRSGEILIYITSNADDDEIMKSLIHLTAQISQNRVKVK